MFSGPASGLWTAPNPWNKAPVGSLKVANNLRFVAPGVIEPRRGYDLLALGTFGTSSSLADELAWYGTSLLCAYDLTKVAIKLAGESFRDFSATSRPNGNNRMRFELASRCCFFNPSDGIRMFDGGLPLDNRSVSLVGERIHFSGGAGVLTAGAVVTDTTTGAVGTSIATASGASGQIYFLSSTRTGAINSGDALSGLATFTGTRTAADTQRVMFAGQEALAWPAGYTVTGATSGATGVILVNLRVGPYVALVLESLTGTFINEAVTIAGEFLSPRYAGCGQGLNITATQSTTNGWQPANSAVAYRYTLCRKDSFGRIIEGAPSGRLVPRNVITSTYPTSGVTRTGGATVFATTDQAHGLTTGNVVTLAPGEANFVAGNKTITVVNSVQFSYAEAGANVSATITQNWTTVRSNVLSCWLPTDVDSSNFIRVYRSIATALATDIPSDDLYQCYESAYLSAAQLSAGVVTFTDVAPESFLEIPLYTNPNDGGDGTLAANHQPPIAEDIAYWSNRMWYLNTTSPHSALLTLVGCGSPDGLQNNDTISFLEDGSVAPGGYATFTAKTTPSGSAEFAVFTDGDAGYNIQRTAQAFVQCVNQSGLWLDAFYISSEEGTPGKILFRRTPTGTSDLYQLSFSVFASRSTAWTPQLPSSTLPLWPPLVSDNNRHAARLWYSKLGQPEAVPLLNFEQINADDAAALKMIPLNYRLLVFKTDGLYFVPDSLPYSAQKLSDHILLAPDSVKRIGDAVFFLSNEGLMVVDGSGVRPVGTPIDTALQQLNRPSSLAVLGARTVACAYRSDEDYLLWVPERSALDVVSTDTAQAFVLSLKGDGFTRDTYGARAAVVDPNTNTIVVAPTNSNALWVERKSLTDADYYDVSSAAIASELVFNDFTDGEPAVMKMAQQCSFLWLENGVSSITALFASEIHPSAIEVAISNPGWGGFSWGEEPWGGFVRTIRRVQPMPVGTANCCQLSVGFRASISGRKFAFLGVDIQSGGDTVANRG